MSKLVTRQLGLTLIAILLTVSVQVSAIPAGMAAPYSATVASPGTAPSPAKALWIDPSKCRGIEIQLHGPNSYTPSCLPMKSGILGPSTDASYTNNSDCNAGDLVLHYNANYDDTIQGDPAFPLCFSGIGSINDFTQIPICFVNGFCTNCWYCIGGWKTWNDQASSFTSSNWEGDMYWDINEGRYWLQFNPNESCPNMGYLHNSFTDGPTNWNDSVSSLVINATYWTSSSTC